MPPPLVSVVVNNFNYARYLRQSVDSALAQRYPRVEVVVVDDASSDGSREVIRSYGSRVVAVLQERNGGQAAAINAGVRASRGDLVMMLDADDYLYPDAAERAVAAFGPGIAKVQYRLDLVDADGAKLDVYPRPEVRFDDGDVVPRLLAMGRYETTVTSGNAFGREVLERILPVPEDEFRISADGYLVSVAPFHGAVRSVEEPLGAYRLHGANAWASGASGGVSGALAERLRRSLLHDASRCRAVEARARALGLVPAPHLGMRDPQHLETRIASLRLDPAAHPYPADRRAVLAARGVAASRLARTSGKRRALLAAWFVAVGLLPRALASRAITWRLVHASRPPAVDRVLKAIRRVLR